MSLTQPHSLSSQGILWAVVEEDIDNLVPILLQAPEGVVTIAHHCTLMYGLTETDIPLPLRILLGKPFPLAISGVAWNNEMGLQAYTVELPPHIKVASGKAHPHITQHQAIRNGIAVLPQLCNDMLAGDYTYKPLTITVPATLRFCLLSESIQQEVTDRAKLKAKPTATP